ncbi:hypothetical protein PISMIDRAFT_382987 [Pisolithus microcarpus 441]|uniref:Uncharacterized protein n=1 Tax=Pisolithus microcarpus 441 TaxID=765257 RepID=A0A0C9YY78_9AGAM|nr:hypothetical protein PISMIDRAFT_382987 [Pisolithus microcarpus 441]
MTSPGFPKAELNYCFLYIVHNGQVMSTCKYFFFVLLMYHDCPYRRVRSAR